jgi:pilus assembly protein Flp/PilA
MEVWTSERFGTGDRTMKILRKLLRNEKGATAIEYGLIAALIAVAAITAMTSVGGSVTNTFNNVNNGLMGAGAAKATT